MDSQVLILISIIPSSISDRRRMRLSVNIATEALRPPILLPKKPIQNKRGLTKAFGMIPVRPGI